MAATKKTVTTDGVTAVVQPKSAAKEPTVRVMIPIKDDEVGGDLKIDQTETVVVNGKTYLLRRGEYLDVPVSVYLQLRNRYPNA